MIRRLCIALGLAAVFVGSLYLNSARPCAEITPGSIVGLLNCREARR